MRRRILDRCPATKSTPTCVASPSSPHDSWSSSHPASHAGIDRRRGASNVPYTPRYRGAHPGIRGRCPAIPTAGSNEPAPALLWIHAGGYVMGTAQQDDRLCLRFSSRLGITVASVDYRLAPENPYPAALGDCYSALTWLASLPAVDPRGWQSAALVPAAASRRRWLCLPATVAASHRHFSCWCTPCSTTGRRSPPPTRTTGYGTGAPTGSAGGHILAMRTHGSRSRDGVTT